MKSLITVNSSDIYTAACLEGLGIIQVPFAGLKHYIQDGRLVEVLKSYEGEPTPVSMLYPDRRKQPKRVKVFMGWISGLMKDYVQ